ncbi:hypothetical protein, partial [Hymenobacter persicinus]
DYPTIQGYQAELNQVYARLGRPAQTSLFTYDDGHGISRPKREAAVAWFRQWLYQESPQPVQEGNLATLSENELLSTTTGQVATAFAQEQLLPQRHLGQARELAGRRKKLRGPALTAAITRQLRLPALAALEAPVQVERRETVQPKGVALQKLILRREGQVPLPALLALPAGSAPVSKVVLWLPDQGKRSLADSVALLNGYLAQNCAVLLADLRGLGETTDPEQFNDKKYFNREYRNALTALQAGQPLLGQRVTDIFMALRFVHQEPRLRAAPVELYATGRAAPAALHAAVLTPAIARVFPSQTITSFEQILTQPTDKDWYSVVVPGVLEYYDLPDLAAALGAKRLPAAPGAAAKK